MNQELDVRAGIAAAGGQKHVAEVIGREFGRSLTASAVNQWAVGKRPIPVEYMSILERESRGALSRRAMRPRDWHCIWPELKSAGNSRA